MSQARRIVGIRIPEAARSALGAALAGLFASSALFAAGAAAQAPPVFAFPQQYFAGDHPKSAVLTELDGDGKLDLVTSFASVVGIVKGNGAGAFGPATLQSVNVTYLAGTLLTGDLDVDGRLDLVACSGNAQAASYVLLGNGGGLAAAIPFAPGGPGPHLGALGDFNLDGLLDVAVAAPALELVLLGNGAGGFVPLPAIAAPPSPTGIAAGDVDADGLLDFVVSEQVMPANAGQVATQRGVGGGSFVVSDVFTTIDPVGFVALGPIQGALVPDLATLAKNATFSTVEVRAGNGAGGWVPTGFLTGPKATGLAVADVTGDANGDVILTIDDFQFGTPIKAVAVYPSAVTGPYTFAVTPPAQPLVADLDGNGLEDVVAITPNQFWAVVLRNVTPLPAGLATYGAGGAGCLGAHGIGASVAPKVGEAGFVVTATNAPRNSLGLLILGNAASAGGDPLGLGIPLGVDLLGSTFLAGVDMPSDLNGLATALVPIPNDPGLANLVFFGTAVFYWGFACPLASPLSLSSSNGLSITIVP